MKRRRVLASLLAAASFDAPAADLADLSLEELGNVIVTSVTGREERLSRAAASIFVISAEDIRRSGVRTLPEALRLAPNLQVARIDAAQYAISARGFNNAISNKLLVLIDGRMVYSPLFSGVFWDMQQAMLENVERIEVISGPGATLWGANAVNGVINVITRAAGDTQGLLAAVGAGNRDQRAAVRYGGRLGEAGSYRVYAKTHPLENTRTAAGVSLADGWHRRQAGFRADWNGQPGNFTVQGDAYEGDSEVRPVGGAVKTSGMNVLGRWSRQLANGGDVRVQAYYDRTEREDNLLLQEKADIVDVEVQHAIPLGSHHIRWGAGYRHASSEVASGTIFRFIPADQNLNWANVFVQDEIRLTPEIDVTLGVKLEHNDYTGVEILPSARIGWMFAPNRLLWGALSRAVRAPARLDREIFAPPAAPFIINGGPDFESEVARVAEIGYRAQPSAKLSYSITVFHHDYDRLRSVEVVPGGFVIGNGIEGTANGYEAWGTFHPLPTWRVSAGYTTLHKDLRLKPGSTDPVGASNLGNDPRYQWMLRSAFDLAPRHALDIMIRRVGGLPTPNVPSYTALDVRYGWEVHPTVELSVVGQNLLDSSHPEFGTAATRSEFRRSVFLNVLVRK
jgi:iron complex outermembrane receptor protein